MSSAPNPDRVRLSLLGRFAATAGGANPRIVGLSSPRQRALIAYLAMQPAFAETRERLAALLWGDRSDRQARQSLRQCLLTLKQELEEADAMALIIEREAIRLDPERIAVDARRLLALAQAEDAADAYDIGDIEYGPFLDGVNVGTEAFEEWVRAERARLETAAAIVFRRSAESCDRAGNGAQAIRAAERLAAVDPLREDAQRLLLDLIARYRGPEAALAHARTFTARLAEELGADPEPETAALIAGIRNASRAVAASPAVAKPAPTAHDALPEPAAIALQSASTPLRTSRRAAGWALAGIAAAAALAAVIVAPWLPAWMQSAAVSAVTPAAEPEAWRSPSVLAGVSADQRALAAQGVYPIVVLPFSSQTAGADRERRLADRITDDLINDLSRVPAFRVIARATSRLYAGRAVDVAAIGIELGVRYVIEGSVRLEEGRVRINVAMVDPRTRLQVWSDRFERDEAERLAAQDEMVRSIARRLNVTVFATEEGSRGPPRAGDAEIGELLAKGWNANVHIFELGVTSGADTYFLEVLRRQPTNGSAMLGLAGYKIGIVASFSVPDREPHLTEAERLVARVLKINPRSILGNYYRGILHKLHGEPDASLAAFIRVLELNPSFAPAYANVGHVMSRMGRLDEAMEHLRYAVRLSPKDPNLGNWSLYAGQIELERRRDDAALEWLKRSVELHPRMPFGHAAFAAALALRGDGAASARHVAKLRSIAPWLSLDVMVERLTSSSAPGAEPRRLIEGLRRAFAPAG